MTTQEAMRQALTTLTPDQLRIQAARWLQDRGIPQDADPLYRAMAVEHSARDEVAAQQYRALNPFPDAVHPDLLD